MDAPQLSSEGLMASIKVIDADTHLSEPHDLWTKRAPASIRDRVPQVKKWGDGISWIIDGDKLIGEHAQSGCCVEKDGSKAQGVAQMKMTVDESHPAAYEAKARVKAMDDMGIWAQIVYPNLLGFGGQKSVIVEPDLRLACTQIYNDAMAEMQSDSGQRLFPMALLPWWDVKEAVLETERAHAMGLRGVNINSDPHRAPGLGPDGKNLPDLSTEYWSPLWEACDSLKLPVNFHIGASETSMDWVGNAPWPGIRAHAPQAGVRRQVDAHAATIGACMLFLDNARVLANLIMSGVVDRHPNLQFVSVESGLGWIPFLLEALDYHYSEFAIDGRLQRKPSEYFRTNFHACFWFEQEGVVDVIRRVGVDNVLFETDFPHASCLYPLSMTAVAETLSGLGETAMRKALSGNAAKLYNIPVG